MTPHRLSIFSLIFMLAAFSLLTVAATAQSIELRLSDGSRWRGEVGDQVKLTYRERHVEIELKGRIVEAANLYLQIEGDFLGGKRTIFRADIVSIETVKAEEESPRDRPTRREERTRGADSEEAYDGPGVIVLPVRGTVGFEIRDNEVRRLLREADRLGPGQIIVLELNTPGGSVQETIMIREAMEELRRHHRVIAWVRPEAISAGCAIASMCHEIYFTRDGAAGAMTAFNMATMQSAQDELLEMWLREAGNWMEENGRSRHIAHAMIVAERELSYDKDEETGRVTFYPDLRGQYVLSRKGSNLTLTASQAVHSGFATGIANTKEELAELLDLPKWYEVSDIGRKMHEEWMSTVERARDRVRRLMHEMQRGTMGDQLANMNHQLRIIRELITWWDRAPNIMMEMGRIGVQPKQVYEAQERELQHRIGEMRRRR
jgi:hypothetical protein